MGHVTHLIHCHKCYSELFDILERSKRSEYIANSSSYIIGDTHSNNGHGAGCLHVIGKLTTPTTNYTILYCYVLFLIVFIEMNIVHCFN